jgi:hypothetical protein
MSTQAEEAQVECSISDVVRFMLSLVPDNGNKDNGSDKLISRAYFQFMRGCFYGNIKHYAAALMCAFPLPPPRSRDKLI